MKKKFLVLGVILVSLVVPITGVFAREGSINDERVNMIYWDRNDWNVFYTGVTNKLSYQKYKPCVGVKNAGGECGNFATQSQYTEYGLSIQQGYQHVHFLMDSNNYQAYVINP